jgi:hypothetical protein
VNGISLPRYRRGLFVIAVLGLAAIAGCEHPQAITLHSSPQLRTRHAHLFYPAKVAIVPAPSPGGRRLAVGYVFAADGSVRNALHIDDASGQVAKVLADFLSEAGLKPVLLQNLPGGTPPHGIDFVITSAVDKMQCIKHLASADGNSSHFTILATVQLTIQFANRAGNSFELNPVSMFQEPPTGVSADSYKPSVTSPADALSLAVSKAIVTLLDNHDFILAFPHEHLLPPGPGAIGPSGS